MNVNCVMIMGHLTKDPEIKSVGNSQVASFRIAANRSYKKGDEWIDKPTFIDCEAWSHNANKVEKSVNKGTRVFIRGRLESDEWSAQDGGKRSKHKIYVLELQIDRPKRESTNSGGDTSESLNDLPF